MDTQNIHIYYYIFFIFHGKEYLQGVIQHFMHNLIVLACFFCELKTTKYASLVSFQLKMLHKYPMPLSKCQVSDTSIFYF